MFLYTAGSPSAVLHSVLVLTCVCSGRLVKELVGELDFSFTVDSATLVAPSTAGN